MKHLISILLFSGAAFAQPTVSNVRADYVPAPSGATPHSYQRIRWNLSASACFHRIQYGTTSSYGDEIQLNSCQQFDLGTAISGLASSTTYHYAVQSSFDGATYGALTSDQTFTTTALPLPHPALPQISGLYTPAFPNTTGYLTATVGANCASPSLNGLISTAVSNQPTHGTVISIPAGTVCPAVQFPNDTQILNIPEDSAHVNTTTGVFTAPTLVPGWTFANGQSVIVSGASCIPGSLTQGNDSNTYNPNTGCFAQGPIISGQVYYLVGVSGSTFQLSATPGGSPIIPGDTGAAFDTMMIEQWPLMNSNWIVIQTSTPDAAFCPQGVRCMGAVWKPKMATIQAQGGCFNCNGGNTGYFTHNIWFRGIEMTFSDASALANTTVDPEASNNLFYAPYSWMSSYFTFDRSYIHGLPYPNRYESMISAYGGRFMAIIDSDLEGMDEWLPNVNPTVLQNSANRGMNGTLAGNTLTIIPGTAYLGPINTCTVTSNITFTVTGGTASGTTYVYLASNCTPTLLMPTGMTGTCTGSAADAASDSHACLVITSASPNWPRDASGGINCLTVGNFNLSSGVASGYSSLTTFPLSAWTNGGTGTAGVLSGAGPGPMSYLNNYWEGTGLLLFWEDSSIVDPQQIWVRQNTFFWNNAFKTGWSGSNNFQYGNRNGPECKHCRQLKFDGNIINGNWAGISPTGPAVLFHTGSNNGTVGTAGGIGQPGYTVQDLDLTNNTCVNTATCFEVGDNGVSNVTPQPAAARIRIKNNLFQAINGFTQTDGNTGNSGNGGAPGSAIVLDAQIEDLIFDHNTIYDNRGTGPYLWHSVVMQQEGVQVTNNFWWFNASVAGVTSELGNIFSVIPAINNTGAALLNVEITRGPGIPGGIFSNNVGVPYYSNFSNPLAPSGLVSDSSICTNLGGTWTGTACIGGYLPNIMTGTSAAANLAMIGFTSTASGMINLKLLYSSPYISGGHEASDGTDIGTDMNALLTAQGAVETPTVRSLTTSSAVVSWFVYDGTVACAVDYATAPNDASTQTGGGRMTASAGQSQSVSLTGLAAGTQYNYRVLCPVNQPVGGFLTP